MRGLLLAPGPAVQMVAESDLPWFSGPKLAFFVVAVLVVGGAIMTITRKNAVASVMSLVATFFGLAAAYALLSAHFLAALQVLVYAGAVMVLFIFVVMVLNRDEVEPFAWRGIFTKVVGVGALVYLIGFKVAPLLARTSAVHAEAPSAEFGTVASVGQLLFTDDLFAFEAVSILLLIAVVGAVVVARVHKTSDPPAEIGGPS